MTLIQNETMFVCVCVFAIVPGTHAKEGTSILFTSVGPCVITKHQLLRAGGGPSAPPSCRAAAVLRSNPASGAGVTMALTVRAIMNGY